jgi:hypothetical protein
LTVNSLSLSLSYTHTKKKSILERVGEKLSNRENLMRKAAKRNMIDPELKLQKST